MGPFDHATPHFPAQGLSFRDKKSLATAFAHSLEPVAFMGSPHDLGMEIADCVFGNLCHGGRFAPALENTASPFEQ